MSEILTVQSSRHAYNVRFEGQFHLALTQLLQPGDIAIVDRNVYELYKQYLEPALAETKVIYLTPSENKKSYQGAEQIISELINNGFRKNHRLIAIGGGITQDITAFTASILFRGVEWIFFPTTLLAQCDSCIGSKTSINFGEFKNQVGGFYPPREIILDVNFMDTLSALDFRSGMGEMLHYFLVSGEEDFLRIEREYDLAFTDKTVLRKLIYRSLDFKRSYAEIDEYDQGPRNVFNYGHTFGHAIESLTHYAVPHGIAVSIGMDIANYLSVKLGYLDDDVRQRIRPLLGKVWAGTQLGSVDIDAYIGILKKDKKAIGSEINAILSRGLGDMFKTALPMTAEVKAWLAEYFNDFHFQTTD